MLILGVNRGNHDVSACLVRDGRLLHFINAERVTRRRHEPGRVWEAVRYCLDAADVRVEDVDLLVQNSHIKDLDRFDAVADSTGVANPDADFIGQFGNVRTIPHHLAHAYCGIGLAPFDECAVLIADGIGQHLDGNRAEAESYYHYRDGELVPIHARHGILHPDGLGFHSFDSLGGLYSMASSYLFGHWNYCGKVMGLAPYGHDDRKRKPLVHIDPPNLTFDIGFRAHLKRQAGSVSDHWRKGSTEAADLAFAVQKELEVALVRLADWLHGRTGSRNLVMAGGVALNCVANRLVLEQTAFERVFVPPPAGDDGIAIGCAFYGWLEMTRGARRFALTHPYYGRRYGTDRVEAALRRESFIVSSKPRDLETAAAKAVADGRVVGWFQGASAMGPRALGDRSILADPRDPGMRDHLNLEVKHREPFRPYGASVLEEKAADFFEVERPCPYMTFAVRVRPGQARKIPAVTHVDGTCRIQTVRRADHPRFYDLIAAFHDITGIPLLINTSLNGAGEPIVETPEEAIRLFLNLRLDTLVLEDHWIERRHSSAAQSHRNLLEHRLLLERAIELVECLYPEGDREVHAQASAPGAGRHVVAPATARLLRTASSGQRLKEALAASKIAERSVQGRTVLKDLARLHEAGAIRLLAPSAGRRIPSRRARGRENRHGGR